jgi:hypothetical protein
MKLSKNPNQEKEEGEGWQQRRKGKASSNPKEKWNERTTVAPPKEQEDQTRAPASGNNFNMLREQEKPRKVTGEDPKEGPPIELESQEKTPPRARDQPVLYQEEG